MYSGRGLKRREHSYEDFTLMNSGDLKEGVDTELFDILSMASNTNYDTTNSHYFPSAPLDPDPFSSPQHVISPLPNSPIRNPAYYDLTTVPTSVPIPSAINMKNSIPALSHVPTQQIHPSHLTYPNENTNNSNTSTSNSTIKKYVPPSSSASVPNPFLTNPLVNGDASLLTAPSYTAPLSSTVPGISPPALYSDLLTPAPQYSSTRMSGIGAGLMQISANNSRNNSSTRLNTLGGSSNDLRGMNEMFPVDDSDAGSQEDMVSNLGAKSVPNRSKSNPTTRLSKSVPKQETFDDDDTPTGSFVDNKNDGKNDDDRAAKRLARKAELARASRRRKKMYVQDLEAKVKKLGQKLEELTAKAASNKSRRLGPGNLTREEQTRSDSQKQVRAQLSELLAKAELSTIEQQQVAELVSKFVQNSRDRQANVDFYLDRVEDCLTPGLQVKFAMWGLDQNDDFYDKPGLWSTLMMKEVGLSEPQLQSILSKRQAIHAERMNFENCCRMLRDVRQSVQTHLRALHSHMDDIQRVMTPLQLAKFYMWIDQNEWVLSMLNQTPKEDTQHR